MKIAEGANYSIDVDDEVATLRVWKRADLSFEEGARLAVIILDHIRRLATDSGGTVRGVVMDLREGPALTGPRTRTVLADIVSACEAADKPIGVVLGSVQRTTLQRALSVAAPTQANFFGELAPARAWATSTVPDT